MSTTDKSPKELMEYRNLGRTGLKVSLLSYGAWVRLFKKIKFSIVENIFVGNIW
jgi:predicted aldo/keto reductase-like oxidoreductase